MLPERITGEAQANARTGVTLAYSSIARHYPGVRAAALAGDATCTVRVATVDVTITVLVVSIEAVLRCWHDLERTRSAPAAALRAVANTVLAWSDRPRGWWPRVAGLRHGWEALHAATRLVTPFERTACQRRPRDAFSQCAVLWPVACATVIRTDNPKTGRVASSQPLVGHPIAVIVNTVAELRNRSDSALAHAPGARRAGLRPDLTGTDRCSARSGLLPGTGAPFIQGSITVIVIVTIT